MNQARTRENRRNRTRWLTLGEAAEFIGVDITTLRGWADAGNVRFFRTPGGHRRFDSQDLNRLLRSTHARPKPSDDRTRPDLPESDPDPRGAGWGSAREPHAAGPAGSAREWLASRPWFAAVPESSRVRVRGHCAELMQVVGAYLAGVHAHPSHAAAARRVGASLGREVAGWGLTPGQSAEVFVYFKRHVTDALASMRGGEAARVRCLCDADVFLGDVLQAMMEAYGIARDDARGAAAGHDR